MLKATIAAAAIALLPALAFAQPFKVGMRHGSFVDSTQTATDLLGNGYEIKATAEGGPGIGFILQKGPSVFVCYDDGETPHMMCAEMQEKR